MVGVFCWGWSGWSGLLGVGVWRWEGSLSYETPPRHIVRSSILLHIHHHGLEVVDEGKNAVVNVVA